MSQGMQRHSWLPSLPVLVGASFAAFGPLVLLLANRDWFFTPEGFLDPWQYVGFFRYYEDLDYSPGDYKLARLPWILAGYFLTRPLSPLPAAYLIHALFLCATSLALFVGVHALFRRPAMSAVVAMVFGFYTHAHGSGGWDYHNTGAGAFYMATFMMLALPSTLAGSRVSLSLTGAMAALAIHTNITLVNFVPALVFVHLTSLKLRPEGLPPWRSLLKRAKWSLVGAVLVTVLLGLINWKVGRDFLFFGTLARIVIRYLSHPENQASFHRPWGSGWIQTSRHLALPAAVFLAGAVSITRRRRVAAERTDLIARSLVVQFLAMVLVWVAWQTAGQTALDWDYFAYPLIPGCFLALGGLLGRTWPPAMERRWLLTTLGAMLVLAACLIGDLPPGLRALEASIAPAIFIAGSAVFFAPLATYHWRPSVATASIVIATLALGNRLVALAPQHYAASDPCKVQSAVYGGIVEGASRLVAIDPIYNRERIWFDENEVISPMNDCSVGLGLMAYSMKSMASVGYLTPPHPMPAADDVPDAAILALQKPDAFLTIITNNAEHVAKWDQRLKGLGLKRQEVVEYRVPVMESGFNVYAWTITAAP